VATDDPAAAAKWKQASTILYADDVASIPLGFSALQYGWSKKVGGINQNVFLPLAAGTARFDQLYIKAGK